MAEGWNYANWVSETKAGGGPEAYKWLLQKNAYQKGYQNGKGAGLQEGIMVMTPFVLGTCWLLYEKAPKIWQKVREKFHIVTKNEVIAVERQLRTDHVMLNRKCPCCGKEAHGIDEIIKIFGFDKDTEGKLVPKRDCKECAKELDRLFNEN